MAEESLIKLPPEEVIRLCIKQITEYQNWRRKRVKKAHDQQEQYRFKASLHRGIFLRLFFIKKKVYDVVSFSDEIYQKYREEYKEKGWRDCSFPAQEMIAGESREKEIKHILKAAQATKQDVYVTVADYDRLTC